MSTENRTFNASRTTRRLLGLLAGLTVWHLMSRFAWTMQAYHDAKGNIRSYYPSYQAEGFDHDASWWDYFAGYTSDFGDILSSHFQGYSFVVVALLLLLLITWVARWVFEPNEGTNKRGGTGINFSVPPVLLKLDPTFLGLTIGVTTALGIITFIMPFM